MDRAVAIYRRTGNLGPLQLETFRFAQERANAAYSEGARLHSAGRLGVRLSREEAIGNHVDRAVRRAVRRRFAEYGIPTNTASTIRVNRREYISRASERTYRVPDIRVGNVALDITLARKMPGDAQVRDFFRADFAPVAVIIVRPRQVGGQRSYLINRPTEQSQ